MNGRYVGRIGQSVQSAFSVVVRTTTRPRCRGHSTSAASRRSGALTGPSAAGTSGFGAAWPAGANDRIRRARPSAGALNGITRNTVMHICQDLGLELVQKRITRDEVYICDEAFFTGTAAEVTPIRELDRIELGKDDYVGSRGPITEKIQTAFFDIVNGRNPKYAHWLTKVNP